MRSFGSKRIPMTHMVSLVRQIKDHGATLYCWSSGGAAYAQESAHGLGIADCFVAFLPKPQLLIDDVSIRDWSLAELHPSECHSMTVPELFERVR
jgi:hypothetical protein